MRRTRITFLPAFFISLAIVLTAAIVVRIRSYRDGEIPRTLPPPVVETPGAESAAPRSVARPSPSRPDDPLSIVPAIPQTTSPPVPPAGDASARWLESVSFEQRSVRGGESGALIVRPAAGVTLAAVDGFLESPAKTAVRPLWCVAAGGAWRCQFTVPQCVACGSWSVGRLELKKPDGSAVTVPSTEARVAGQRVHLAAMQCDSTPPQLHALSIDDSAVTADRTVLLAMTVADDFCGVESIAATAESRNGQRLAMTPAVPGDENTWSGRLEIGRATDRGRWRITSVVLIDRGGNSRIYSESDAVLKDAGFGVP